MSSRIRHAPHVPSSIRDIDYAAGRIPCDGADKIIKHLKDRGLSVYEKPGALICVKYGGEWWLTVSPPAIGNWRLPLFDADGNTFRAGLNGGAFEP
jgi:hypothetical protein